MNSAKYLMFIVAAMVILGGLGAIMLSVRDARTISVTDTYQLTTTNVTTANVQLSEKLWEDDIARVTLTSNTTSDIPVASSYTSNTRNLALTGLADNSTRSFEVQYYTAGLTDFPWADTGIKFLPTILIMGVILIIMATVIAVWSSARSG